MKNIQEIEIALNRDFLKKDVWIELVGDITYFFKIKNLKFLINQTILILSDNAQNQINISLDEISNVNILEELIELDFTYNEKIRIYL